MGRAAIRLGSISEIASRTRWLSQLANHYSSQGTIFARRTYSQRWPEPSGGVLHTLYNVCKLAIRYQPAFLHSGALHGNEHGLLLFCRQ